MNITNNLTSSKQIPVDISETLDGLLALIGQELKASRSYIFTIDLQCIGENTYEWCLPGIESQKSNLANFFISEKWIGRLKKDEIILISDITQEELKIRAELGRQNIISLVIVPLRNGEELWGFLGVDECVVRNREWNPEEIQTLRRFSGLINDVHQRILADSSKDPK
jgi:GAF domain-containing protein